MRHISPFRYPGGKSWLAPSMVEAVSKCGAATFVEPFAGGASVGLAVASKLPGVSVGLTEKDPGVAATWRAILGEERESLCDLIATFDMSRENAEAYLSLPHRSDLEMAFATILRNRCNYGGIIGANVRMLKSGDSGRGVLSRWYPETLCKRIMHIGSMSDRIHFCEGDALEAMEATKPESMLFVDPPYCFDGKGVGKRLYSHWDVDQQQVFQSVANHDGPVIATHANDVQVKQMLDGLGLHHRVISMHGNRNVKQQEIVIANDQASELIDIF